MRRVKKKIREAESEEIKAPLIEEEKLYEEELRVFSESPGLGDYNLIASGLEEFKDALKAKPGKNTKSKSPESDHEYVLWKAIESRAGG